MVGTYETVTAAQKDFGWVIGLIQDPDNPYEEVEVFRGPYSKRGAKRFRQALRRLGEDGLILRPQGVLIENIRDIDDQMLRWAIG